MQYPVIIKEDESGYMVSFPDIPEALTCGESYDSALSEAKNALVTAFEFYFEDQRPIPLPSTIKNCDVIDVPLSVWVKVLVLNTMLHERITQTELAKRMGSRKQEIQRVINLDHNTKIDTLNLAMKVMGKKLSISIN